MRFLLGALFVILLSSPVNGDHEILVLAPKEAESTINTSKSSVITIDSASQGQRSLADLLNQESGIYVSRSYGLKEDSISIRGFSSSQVKILIDGLPVPLQDNSLFRISDIPLSMIDRIVISRGPMSSSYGKSSMGGVINIITKQNLNRSKIQVSYGSFASLAINGETYLDLEPVKMSFLAFANKTNGRYIVSSHQDELFDTEARNSHRVIENNQEEQYGGKLGLAYQKVYASCHLDNKKRGIPGMQGHPTPHIREKSQSVQLKLNMSDLRLAEFSLDWAVYRNLNFRSYDDPLGEQTGFVASQISRGRDDGAELKFKILSFDLFIPSFSIGVENEDLRYASFHASRQTTSLIASSELYLLDERILLSPSASHVIASQLNSVSSLGLGLLYKFNESLSLRSQFGNGFRYPTFEELYLERGMVVGNKDLKVEETLGGDVGLAWSIPLISSSFSYFQYRSQNLIEYMLVSGFQYKPFNFRSTKTRGVEFDLNLHHETTTVGSSLTWQEVKDDDMDSEFYAKFIPMKPWFYGRIYADTKFYQTYGLHYELNFARSRFINRSNTKALPNNALNNIGFSYQYSESIKARFDIRNIFNRDNIDTRGFPLPGRSFYLVLEKAFL